MSSLGMTVLFQEVAVTRVPSICLTDFFQHATHTSQGSRARLMDVLVFLACTASMSQTSLTWNVASAAGGEGWRGGMKTTEDSSSQEEELSLWSAAGWGGCPECDLACTHVEWRCHQVGLGGEEEIGHGCNVTGFPCLCQALVDFLE